MAPLQDTRGNGCAESLLPSAVYQTMEIGVHDERSVMVIDPLGRRLGFDPITGITYESSRLGTYAYYGIANSQTGVVDSRASEFGLGGNGLPPGVYTLIVMGRKVGTYNLWVHLQDANDESTAFERTNVPTHRGSVDMYRVVIPRGRSVKPTLSGGPQP